MKRTILISIILLSSCNSQELSTKSDDRVIADTIEESQLTIILDSHNVKSNDTSDQLSDSNVIPKEIKNTLVIKSLCPKLEEYLQKVNWRKHPIDNCYVVELNESNQLSTFVDVLYEFNVCSKKMNESDLIQLLGEPIRRKENRLGSFMEYPFVKYDSIRENKQQLCSYHLRKNLNSNYYIFPKVVPISFWPPEKPEH